MSSGLIVREVPELRCRKKTHLWHDLVLRGTGLPEVVNIGSQYYTYIHALLIVSFPDVQDECVQVPRYYSGACESPTPVM